MNSASNHTQRLLKRIHQQILQLNTQLNSLKKEKNSSPIQRFDNQLFTPILKSPAEYLSEIERNFAFLEQQVNSDNIEQTQFLTEKLIAQIAALQRELATQPLRTDELTQNAKLTRHDLYQKLSQYQDYQRRLKNMIRDKESLLNPKRAISEQQSLQREIAVLEGRYSRCCNAIKTLEFQIEKHENH